MRPVDPDRQRVFILAGSRDEARTWISQWVNEAPKDRRRGDCRYLSSARSLDGLHFGPNDRVVALPGADHHREHGEIVDRVYAAAVKRRAAIDIEEAACAA